MKKFEFRLEALLRYRQMQKEQAQLKFAEVSQKLREEQEKLVRLEYALNENITAFCNSQTKNLTIDLFRSYQDYFDKIRESIKIQSARVEEASVIQQGCLNELQNAVKNCEAVEKLKVKRFLQYQITALNEEQKFLDEIGLQNFVRRN